MSAIINICCSDFYLYHMASFCTLSFICFSISPTLSNTSSLIISIFLSVSVAFLFSHVSYSHSLSPLGPLTYLISCTAPYIALSLSLFVKITSLPSLYPSLSPSLSHSLCPTLISRSLTIVLLPNSLHDGSWFLCFVPLWPARSLPYPWSEIPSLHRYSNSKPSILLF